MNNLKKQKAIPYLSVDEMKKLKSELKDKYQDAETRVFNEVAFKNVLENYVHKEDIFLDMGSANGYIFQLLDHIGVIHSYGADIDDYLSKGFPHKGLKTFDFNMDKYPYPDKYFNVISAIETIEHLENPFHFVREISRLLKDGGICILSTPNPNHIFNKILFMVRGEFYRFLRGNDHITFLTDPILKKGLLKFFEIIEVSYLIPEMPWRFLTKFKYPANKHFGRVVLYVFKKRQLDLA